MANHRQFDQFWELASTNFQAALAKTAPLLKPLGSPRALVLVAPTRLRARSAQALRKAQVPKMHSHMAVLAPLCPEGFSTYPDRHLRNVDEEQRVKPHS
jgi:hypothetical protein